MKEVRWGALASDDARMLSQCVSMKEVQVCRQKGMREERGVGRATDNIRDELQELSTEHSISSQSNEFLFVFLSRQAGADRCIRREMWFHTSEHLMQTIRGGEGEGGEGGRGDQE
jgi:hypothetical protein